MIGVIVVMEENSRAESPQFLHRMGVTIEWCNDVSNAIVFNYNEEDHKAALHQVNLYCGYIKCKMMLHPMYVNSHIKSLAEL